MTLATLCPESGTAVAEGSETALPPMGFSAMANLMTRDDTLLGVCEGLGDEFGIAPNALRIALAAIVLVAPVAAIALYLALGAILLAVRMLWPVPSAAATAPALPQADNDAALPVRAAA